MAEDHPQYKDRLFSFIFGSEENKAKEDLGSAIDRAITDMPDDFVIKPFLVAHRAEVKGMLLTEYKEAETMQLFKEEGRAEGRAEGEARGRAEGETRGEARGRAEGEARGILKTLAGLIHKGLLSIKDAASEANMTEAEFTAQMAALGV